MPEEKELPPLLSRRQVAKATRRCERTIQGLADRGILPPVVQAGHRSLWARADVEKIIGGVLAARKEAGHE